MSDMLSLVGEVLDSSHKGARDAVHIAIASVTTDDVLNPGDRISLVDGSTDLVWKNDSTPDGVVDPFLRDIVLPGHRFFMFMFPNTITRLRHVWSHPSFDAAYASKMREMEEER